MRVGRALGAGAIVAAVLAGAAGCGGATAAAPEVSVVDPTLDPETTLAPEDVRAPAIEVSAGLRVISELALGAADSVGVNRDEAREPYVNIAPTWARIGGTVRATDPGLRGALDGYIAALGEAVEADDALRARAAAEAIGTAVDTYLARYPVDSVPETSAPQAGPTMEPSATATPGATGGPAQGGEGEQEIEPGLEPDGEAELAEEPEGEPRPEWDGEPTPTATATPGDMPFGGSTDADMPFGGPAGAG
jgi:hypothetical protein